MQFHEGIGDGPFTVACQCMSWLHLLLISQEKWLLKLLNYVNVVLAVHQEPIVENTIKIESKKKTSLLVVLVVKQTNSESLLILLSVIYVVQTLKPDLDYDLAEKNVWWGEKYVLSFRNLWMMCLSFVHRRVGFLLFGSLKKDLTLRSICRRGRAWRQFHVKRCLAFPQKPQTSFPVGDRRDAGWCGKQVECEVLFKNVLWRLWAGLCADKGPENRRLIWGAFFLPLSLPLVP